MKKAGTRLSRLRTEASNPASAGLDSKSALEIARLINQEDAKVADVVRQALPQIAQAMDLIADAIAQGGRLIYVGAGTSGRIAALDAAECPPTFNTAPKTVQFVMAGGTRALYGAREDAEDSYAQGRRDMIRRRPGRSDVVVGISASGRTPYTLAAVEYARSRGAQTVAVTCNPASVLQAAAHLSIVTPVGAEVVSGSTRMKAGTAQKLVCNMLTTGALTRLGYVYGNLMVNVHLKNKKLLERGLAILEQATDVDRTRAERALRRAGSSVPLALVMIKTGASRAQAERLLKAAGGNVRRAIEQE